jgi:hypothetical protein
MEDNNIDEYYSWTCNKCHEMVRWECNFDGYDEITLVNKRNAVCEGDYFCGYQQHYGAWGSGVGAVDLSEYIAYQIPDPPLELSKRELGQYLSAQILSQSK